MLGRTHLGGRTAQSAARVNQFGRRVVMPAGAAIVARLVGALALGTSAPHEPIGQEGAGLSIEQLLDVALFHQTRGADRLPNLAAQYSILFAVRAAVVVELDAEPREVFLVSLLHLGDEVFLGAPLLAGTQHDRRAVGIVGTHVAAFVAAQLLEAHPEVGHQVFHQMADVDVPIGVRQSRGH